MSSYSSRVRAWQQVSSTPDCGRTAAAQGIATALRETSPRICRDRGRAAWVEVDARAPRTAAFARTIQSHRRRSLPTHGRADDELGLMLIADLFERCLQCRRHVEVKTALEDPCDRERTPAAAVGNLVLPSRSAARWGEQLRRGRDRDRGSARRVRRVLTWGGPLQGIRRDPTWARTWWVQVACSARTAASEPSTRAACVRVAHAPAFRWSPCVRAAAGDAWWRPESMPDRRDAAAQWRTPRWRRRPRPARKVTVS